MPKKVILTCYVNKDGSKDYRCGNCGCMWASAVVKECPKCSAKFGKTKTIKAISC